MTEKEYEIEVNKVLELVKNSKKNEDYINNEIDSFNKAKTKYLRIAELYASLGNEYNSDAVKWYELAVQAKERSAIVYYNSFLQIKFYDYSNKTIKNEDYYNRFLDTCKMRMEEGNAYGYVHLIEHYLKIKQFNKAKEVFDIIYDQYHDITMLYAYKVVINESGYRNYVNKWVLVLINKIIVSDSNDCNKYKAYLALAEIHLNQYEDSKKQLDLDNSYDDMLHVIKLFKNDFYDNELNSVFRDVRNIYGLKYQYTELRINLYKELNECGIDSNDQISIEYYHLLTHYGFEHFGFKERNSYLSEFLKYTDKCTDNKEEEAIYRLMVIYLMRPTKYLYYVLCYNINKFDNLNKGLFYIALSKYANKKQLVSKALSLKLDDKDKLRLYLNLYYSDNKKDYLNSIENISNNLAKIGYYDNVVEAYAVLDMDIGNYQDKIINYINKYSDNVTNDMCLSYVKAYRYLYEKTGDEKYSELESKYYKKEYMLDNTKSYRFMKYFRINKFENFVLQLDALPYSYIDDYFNVATNVFTFVTIFNSLLETSILPDYDEETLKNGLYDTYYSLCILMGFEILWQYRNIEFETDKYLSNEDEEIGYIADDIFSLVYVHKDHFISKFYNLEDLYEEVLDIALNNYDLLTVRLFNVIDIYCKSNDTSEIIRLLNSIYEDFKDDDKYKFYVEQYERGYYKIFNYIANTIAIDFWNKRLYDEYLKLLKFIERSYDTIGQSVEGYKQFMAKSIYYNLACYYLISGEERCNLELGYEYYMKFKDNYEGNYHKLDLENDNLHFILREFLML